MDNYWDARIELGNSLFSAREELKTDLKEDEKVKLETLNEELSYQERQKKWNLITRMNSGDTFAERIKLSDTKRSSWLTDRSVCSVGDVYDEMDNASMTFRSVELSDSQKTKRGKKFLNKAKRQAKIIKELNIHKEGRKSSLSMVMTRNIERRRENGELDESYLSDISHLEDMGEMVNDMAFFAIWHNQVKDKDSSAGEFMRRFMSSMHERDTDYIQRVDNVVDPEKCKAEYLRILLEIEKLDVDLFNYKSDEEFISNYSCKLAALRMYSHGDKLLSKVQDDPSIKKIAGKLAEKTELIKDMVKDYENRALLIQSPYYALLAGKDIDSLSDKDLRKRLLTTKDVVAQEYILRILDRRNGIAFQKGKKASSIIPEVKALPEKMKKARHDRDIALMENREAILKKYRDTVKAENRNISNADADDMAMQRYIDEHAEPYIMLNKFQNRKINRIGEGISDQDVKDEYETFMSEHPGLSYEDEFIRKRPFLDYGNGISKDYINAVYILNRNLESIYKGNRLIDKIVYAGCVRLREYKEYYEALESLAGYRKKYQLLLDFDNGWSINDVTNDNDFSNSYKRKRANLTRIKEKCIQKMVNSEQYQDLCTQVISCAAKMTYAVSDYTIINGSGESAERLLRGTEILRDPERISRKESVVKNISETDMVNYGYATKKRIMTREDAEILVNKSNGLICAKEYKYNDRLVEIRPSLPEFVTDKKSNKEYPLRLAYNLLIKGVVRYMVNKKGNYKIDAGKFDALDDAMLGNDYRKLFDVLESEIESDLKKQKWSKDDLAFALNAVTKNNSLFANETYGVLETYGSKLKSYEDVRKGKLKEIKKLEKSLKNNPDKRNELESKIEIMKKALEIQDEKVRHEKAIFAEIRDMDVNREDIPIPNQCSGNGEFIGRLKTNLGITDSRYPIRRYLIKAALKNPEEAAKLLKDVKKNLSVYKSTLGLRIEENEIEGYLDRLYRENKFNKETITEIEEKLKRIEKYEYHEAAVIAEYEGKIITTEGFAPDATEIMSAPFSLHGAIGIYYGNRNDEGSHTGFDGFYENDSPVLSNNLEIELNELKIKS
ncbi:MAG: hypothetical protein K6G19_06035 [Lachnospiraceae bacterium]|nr:hypothetical protein [Lachnospiraceae bacterium]